VGKVDVVAFAATSLTHATATESPICHNSYSGELGQHLAHLLFFSKISHTS
jgi:hypothetical protein